VRGVKPKSLAGTLFCFPCLRRRFVREHPGQEVPDHRVVRFRLGYLQKRFDEARAAFDRCEELNKDSNLANLGRAQALAAQGRYAEALTTMLKRREWNPANEVYWVSAFYAGSGDKEKALANLQKAFNLGYRDFPSIKGNPVFDSLRDDARFKQLIKTQNKPVAGRCLASRLRMDESKRSMKAIINDRYGSPE
jgi:tetratricopeptide (TPR) repeat protein